MKLIIPMVLMMAVACGSEQQPAVDARSAQEIANAGLRGLVIQNDPGEQMLRYPAPQSLFGVSATAPVGQPRVTVVPGRILGAEPRAATDEDFYVVVDRQSGGHVDARVFARKPMTFGVVFENTYLGAASEQVEVRQYCVGD
jgi:hypothetical protein